MKRKRGSPIGTHRNHIEESVKSTWEPVSFLGTRACSSHMSSSRFCPRISDGSQWSRAIHRWPAWENRNRYREFSHSHLHRGNSTLTWMAMITIHFLFLNCFPAIIYIYKRKPREQITAFFKSYTKPLNQFELSFSVNTTRRKFYRSWL